MPISNFHSARKWLAVTASLLGVLGLLGWITGIRLLASGTAISIPMAASTALSFLGLGLTLLLTEPGSPARFRTGSTIVLGIVSLYGSLTLLGSLFHANLFFADALFPTAETFGPYPIGRMSPVTGGLFLLSGIALLLWRWNKISKRIADAVGGVGVITLVTGLISALGYAYGSPVFAPDEVIPLSITTSVGFVVLGFAMLLSAGPECFILRPMIGDSPRAQILRSLLPVMILFVLIEGFLDERVYRLLNFSRPYSVAIESIALSILLTVLAFRISRSVFRAAEKTRTERDQANTQLEILGHTLRSVSECISITDTENRILFVNEAFRKAYGYAEVDLLGKDIAVLHPPGTDPALAATIRTATLAGGWEGEVLNRRKDGTDFPVHLSSSTVRDQQGRTIALVGVATDITERNRTEAAVRLRSEITRNIAEGVYLVSVKTLEILYANEVMEHMFGYAPGEMIGKPVSIINAPSGGDPAQTANEIAAAMAETGSWRGDVLTVKKDGTPFWSHATISLMHHPEYGDIFVSLQSDISEQKRTKELIAESEHRLSIVFNNTTDMLCLVQADPDGVLRFAAVNRPYLDAGRAQNYELTEGDFVGKEVSQVLSDVLRFEATTVADEMERLRQVIRSRELLRFERAIPTPARTVYLDTSLIPIVETSGVCTHLLWSSRDVTERQRAAHALRESTERWESLFNNSPDSIAVYRAVDDGKDFIFTDFNRTAEKTDHISREDVVGRRISEMFPGANELGFLDVFRRVWQSGTTEHMSSTLYQDNRISGWRENTIYRLTTGEIVAIYSDISERMKAENALRDSEEKFRRLFHNHSAVKLMIDPATGMIEDANPAASEFYGWTLDELKGMTIHQINIARPNEMIDVMMQKVVTHRRERFEFQHRLKDGSLKDVEVFSSAIDIAGKTHLHSIIVDITGRKLAEVALKESEMRFRSLFENAADPILLVSMEGQILQVNPVMCQLLGRTHAELESMRTIDLNTDEFKPKVRERLEALRRNGALSFETAHRAKDGTRLLFEINSKVIELQGRQAILSVYRNITERKRAEEAVKESEANLHSLISNRVESIWSVDREYRFVIINDYFRQAFRTAYGQDIKPGISAIDTLTSSVRAFWKPKYDAALAGTATTFQFSETINGELRHFDVFLNPILIDGRVTGASALSMDITERYHAEHLVAESEKRYRTLFARATDGIAIMDLNLRFLDVNDSFAKMHEYRPDDLLSMNFRDLECPNAVNTGAERMQHILKGDTLHFEVDHFSKSGRTISFDVVANLIELEGRKHILSFHRDITEQKRAQEAIRESEERFQLIIANSPDLTLVQDHTGTVTYVSPQIEHMLGYTPDTFMSKRLPDQIHPDDKEHAAAVMRRALAGHEIVDCEYRFFGRRGELHWLSHTVRPLIRNGEMKSLFSTIRDITERKRTEEERMKLEKQLIQAQKMESVGTLSSGIAHDFNNILNIIMGNLSLLENNPDDREKFPRRVQSMTRATERGAHLVKQLLTFARKTTPDRRLIDVNDLVRDISKIIDETFPKNIAVSMQLDTGIAEVDADPNQLHQVLLNLSVNARDAMSQGGILAIATSVVAGDDLRTRFPNVLSSPYIRISVADTGVGIEEQYLKDIFDPFFTTKGVGKGTGLGLAVAYGIVQNHSGFIEVKSRVGVGSEFIIYLPVAQRAQPAAEPPRAEISSSPGGTETLLFIDDEALARDMAIEQLTEKGYRVLSATDGEEAVAVFREHRAEIALVLSDFGLPKFNGEEVYRRIRELDPGVQFVLMTGFIEQQKIKEFGELGVCEILHKPYRLTDLLAVIREVLDRRKAKRPS